MRLLSVDPGRPSGWALWSSRNELVSYGLLLAVDGPAVVEFLGRLFPDCRGSHLVIEGQWYLDSERMLSRLEPGPDGAPRPVWKRERRKGAHYGAVEKVVECRRDWESACRISGMTAEVVKPGVWIPAMSKGHPAKTARDRVHAVTLARWPGLAGAMTKDESAAILLGEWALEERARWPRRGGALPARYRGLEPARRAPKG